MMPELTTAHILALPAGPELDGLIDEHVWGIDLSANTPDKRFRAIVEAEERDLSEAGTRRQEILLCGKLWVVSRDPDPIKFLNADPENQERWIWREREGKPWQADLEAHVAAWRAPPTKPWSTDIAAAWEIMATLPQPLAIQRIDEFADKYWDVYFLETHGRGDTAPVAICRAALLATCAGAALQANASLDLNYGAPVFGIPWGMKKMK